jgi:hypothetical protein
MMPVMGEFIVMVPPALLIMMPETTPELLEIAAFPVCNISMLPELAIVPELTMLPPEDVLSILMVPPALFVIVPLLVMLRLLPELANVNVPELLIVPELVSPTPAVLDILNSPEF